MPELRIIIPDELERKISAAQPEYLDRKGFICLVLDNALDNALKMLVSPAAGNTYGVDHKPPLQFPPDLEVTNSPASTEAVPSKKSNSFETLSLTPPLEKFEKLIREFFRLKKGSKSKTAWAHLMGGLIKIQDKYGDAVVEEQLMAAINGRWAGITLKNYEEFGIPKPKPQWQQEPEMKHPAHRDFTAERIAAERESTDNFLNF